MRISDNGTGRYSDARAIVVVVALAAALSACSVSRLNAPVAGFAEASKAAQKNLNEQLDAVDTAILETALQDAISDRTASVLSASDDDCGIDSERCRLVVATASGEWPFTRSALEHGVRDLMTGLVAYASGLEKIMSAGTTAQIQKATADIKTSAIGLAGTIEQAGGPPGFKARITALAGPLSELAGFGLRIATDQAKLRAMRDAVNLMETDFDEMAFVFEEASSAATNHNLAVLYVALVGAQNAYIDKPHDKAALSAYRAAAEKYDAALRGKPKDMFVALREAHRALAAALHGRDLTAESIWPYLQTVLAEAEKFATIVKQLQVAANTGT